MNFLEYCEKYKAKLKKHYEPNNDVYVFIFDYPDRYRQTLRIPTFELRNIKIHNVESAVIERAEREYLGRTKVSS
jgi:hypothetical protein